jgi:hypothetical protein
LGQRVKLFWSWQSDTPGKTGRHFIRKSLEAAVSEIQSDLSLVEPSERDAAGALHIDQDRQDVSGSSDLAIEILNKIAVCEIFVGDVTTTGILQKSLADAAAKVDPEARPKKLINSNVAIELGYAYHAKTSRFVLLVMNSHYGKHADLPFDLKGKGGTIVFDLGPGTASADIERAKKALTARFVQEIRLCLKNRPQQSDAG